MIHKIFPTAIILMNIGACVVYACKGNIRMTLYWFAAALLNTVVTY